MGGINMLGPQASPLDRIATALQIAHTIYQIKGAQQASEIAKTKADQERAQFLENNNPDSNTSKLKREDQLAYVHSSAKKGYIDAPTESKLADLIGGLPGRSGVQAMGPAEEDGTTPKGGIAEIAAMPGMSGQQLDSSLKEGGALQGLIKGIQAAASKQTGFDFRDTQMEKKMDNAIHQKTLAAIRTDPNEMKRLGQYQNLDNATNTLFSNPITPESIHEYQQSVRSNLGIGSGGVGERQQTYMDSLGLHGEKWAEIITGDPANIAKDNKMVQHFKQLAATEQQNVRDNFSARLDLLTAGNEGMYDRRPDLKSGLIRAVNAAKKQFGTSDVAKSSGDGLPGMSGANASEAPSAPHGNKVVQNGHTFVWNADKKKYE